MTGSRSLTGHPLRTPPERLRARHLLLGLALTVELIAFVFFESDAIRGAAVGVLLFLLAAIGLLSWVFRGQAHEMRISPYLAAWSVIALVGAYGLVLAGMRGNNVYYIAADLYHFFVELLLGAAVASWALGDVSAKRMARWTGLIGIVLGVIGMALIALSAVGVQFGGGNLIAGSGLFRLELGRGFPITALIFTTAALFSKRQWDRRTRLLLVAAFVVLMIDLVFTFKRTMWLAYLGAVFLIRAPRRWIMIAGAGIVMAVAAFALIAKIYPGFLVALGGVIGDALTYNKSYTIEDTIQERLFQYLGLLPYIRANLLGYGFGAEFSTYVPTLKHFDRVHYVHNYYLYHLLQVGLPGVAALFGTWLWYMRRLWAVCSEPSDFRWVVRGALAATAVLAVSGFTLVSTHTIFAGYTVGLGVIALKRVAAEKRVTV